MIYNEIEISPESISRGKAAKAALSETFYWEVTKMRGYEAAKILKEKGITIEDVNAEIAYRKETNALSNQPQNEAFMNMTLNEVVRIKEMWDID